MGRWSISEYFPARLTIGILLFFCLFVLSTSRSNFALILLAMVEPVPDENGTIVELPDYGPRYPWNSYDQSILLGIFFLGYLIMYIPIGILIDRFGFTKHYFMLTMAMTIVFGFVQPSAAIEFSAMVVLRLLVGIMSSGTGAAIQKVIGRWAPIGEKGKFLLATFGTDIGQIFTLIVSGYITESFGWQYSFYYPVIVIVPFMVVWWFCMFDTPADHPRILPNEQEHIENGTVGVTKGLKTWPPFGNIITSIPFLSLAILAFGSGWGRYFILTASPRFMYDILGFNLGVTGVFSSLPHILRILAGIVFASIGDHLRTMSWISPVWIRKGGCIFSHIIPGLFLIGIPYVSTYPYWCVAFITLSYGFSGATLITSDQNLQDLAPNYVSTMTALTGTLSVSTGVLSPLVVGYFTRDRSTIEEWKSIYLVGAAVVIGSSIVFLFLGSTEIQAWNAPTRDKNHCFMSTNNGNDISENSKEFIQLNQTVK